jgi:ribosome maturation factor RimP
MAVTETWLQQVIDQELEGVELVLLEQSGGPRQRTLRLFIDHAEGVDHELCGRVSEVVGKAIDDVDAVNGAYTLEVSSPGIERPLRKREHFEAQMGKKVYVRTRIAVGGSKVWQGRLAQVTSEAVVIEEAGREARIEMGDIVSAHLIYEFNTGGRG